MKIDKLVVLFWSIVCAGLYVSISINVWYGFIACLILSIFVTYTVKDDLLFNDIIGVCVTGFLIFSLILGVIISVLINVYEYDEIQNEKSYKIKLLENETIVYERDNDLITVKDPALYYKCKLYNCSDFIIKVTEFKPKNKNIADNLSPDSKIEYNIK